MLILETMAFIVNATPLLNNDDSPIFDNPFDSTIIVYSNGFGDAVSLAGYVAYFAIQESRFGSTVFKRLFGVRVASLSHDRVTLRRAAVRTITKPFEIFLFPLGIGWIIFSPSHRRFGDVLAGTNVVRRTKIEHLAESNEIAAEGTGTAPQRSPHA